MAATAIVAGLNGAGGPDTSRWPTMAIPVASASCKTSSPIERPNAASGDHAGLGSEGVMAHSQG